MKNHMRFRPYEPEQLFLLPPDLKQWLPEDDLVYFIIDVVNELNLDPIYELYDASKGGQPPYNARMMVGLLVYAYCMGMPSSRKIEQATYHSIPFRVLTANQHPDHDTIAEYIATGRVSHSDPPACAVRGRIPKSASKTERMARKLKTIKGHKIYSRRKHIVEPVFGQIKEVRGFRRFSFRGLEKVAAEWDLICLTHDLLKLFRANRLTAPA